MEQETLRTMRVHAEDIFRSCLTAVDPYEAVRRHVRIEAGRLIVGTENRIEAALELKRYRHIYLVGGGKATAPMAAALEELLGTSLHKGLVNVKYGFGQKLAITEVTEAGHPVPDRNGVIGTGKILRLLEGAREEDLVFSVISGGGSALLPQPAGNITLSQKQEITRMLLSCGAAIDEINALRKHISLSKGGQMARVAFPATVVNLMLSDVVGDRTDVIASGPFTADASTFHECRDILDRYDLADIPASIGAYISAGVEGRIPETPKSGDPVFDHVFHLVVGSNIQALEAAEQRAAAIGYRTLLLSSMVEGETREVARVHCAIAKEILSTGRPLPPPACVISGGETTVTLHGQGTGGRNQEFCLAAALDLAGVSPRVVILSAGTDGNDGPTDAAGAVVDPFTVARGRAVGAHARRHLRENDAYPFLEKTKDLLKTGPTRTNVMDVRLVLVG